jgi:hypothetical protein
VSQAADIGVIPKRLIVVDKMSAARTAKLVYVSTDQAAGITKGSDTDASQISVQFDVVYGNGNAAGAFTLAAGASDGTAGWLVNKPSVAKYVNRIAPTGPTQAKVAVIKPGKLLKLVAKGLGDVPLDVFGGGDPGTGGVRTAYCVTNGQEKNCHCSDFTGCAYKLIAGGTGAKLACKTGTGDVACSAVVLPTTTSTTVAGSTITTTSTSTTTTINTSPAAPLMFPVAVGRCLLDDFVASQSCGDLPSLAFAPDEVDAACWAGLDGTAVTSATVREQLPAACCPLCGGEAVVVALGDSVGVQSGVTAAVLTSIQGCLDADPPITDFLLPVIDCDDADSISCNAPREVVAFVPIRLTGVHSVGDPKGLDFDVVCADGTCGLGFCAPAATCETCALECGTCP